MLKFTTRFTSVALMAIVALTSLHAGTSRSVDARSILTASTTKDASLQATAFSKPLNLQRATAEALFSDRPTELELTNFPLPGHPDATLTLHRTRDVINETSEIIIGTKNGGRRMTAKPVTSYYGILNNDPTTRVSLHYSTDDLTGLIHMADGSKLLIGRDGVSTTDYVAHSIFVEGALEGGSVLRDFTCGVTEQPVTIEDLKRAAKDAQVEVVQNGYLKEIRVALEVKEDVDSLMKRRGLNDEQILAYIAKIWAAVSQVYEQELNATVFLSYIHFYTEDEPSPYFNNGRNPGALLGEFSGQWRQRQSPPRTLAHLMTLIRPSGGSYVGGIAYGGNNISSNLCNPTSSVGSYSVSTIYTNATDVPGLPTRSNAFVWDVFVIAHEMGHNCGANHTHNCSWNPPLDTCQTAADGTDGCVQDIKYKRGQPGTIMSYCHLENGQTTPLTFGPERITSKMAGWIAASSCVTAPPNATVKITYPRGSETWDAGQIVEILWVSEGVTNVKLEYSPNEGGTWVDIIASTPSGAKKYAWTIPNVATTRLLIRISDADNPATSHTSLATFSIVVPQQPTITLNDPVGGARLAQGAKFTIKWTKIMVGSVDIEFAPDGTTWTMLKADTNSTGYAWTVPNVVTSNARIRVTSASNPNVQSISGEFSIGQKRFEMIKPKTGDIICQSFDNGFIWSGDFIEKIKIRFSTDGVTITGNNAISAVSVAVAPGQFISVATSDLKGLAPGTPITLHIIDDGDESELVKIPGVIAQACNEPSSVAGEVVTESDLKIVSVTPSPANQSSILTLSTEKAMTFDVSIVDMAGNATVLHSNMRVENSGLHYINLPLQAVASGAYMVSVRAGGVQVSTQLRVAR